MATPPPVLLGLGADLMSYPLGRIAIAFTGL